MSRLDELINVITKEHVYIQTHNYPDQDALACALGLQTLLRERGLSSTICYEGLINKVNTVAMVDYCRIPISHIDEIKMKPDDEIILVDGQFGNVNVKDFAGQEIACIDHHAAQDVSIYRYYDIRNTGACATIIAGYFLESDIEMDCNVATALLYGLKVDTASLMRGVTNDDIDMFTYLYKKADLQMLRRFDGYSLKIADLDAYQKAISTLKVYKNIGIANIGDECSEAIMGTVSDLLISLAEIDFSVVYSYRVGGVKFSVRSTSEELDASEILKEALDTFGGGGGHSSMAAGFIPDLTLGEAMAQAGRVVDQVEKIIDRIHRENGLYKLNQNRKEQLG